MTISPLGTAVWQQGFELVEGDITDEARLRPVLARLDAVMHFAAHAYVGESVENPRKYFRNNVVAALSLLNCAMDAGIRRFVFSSTCADPSCKSTDRTTRPRTAPAFATTFMLAISPMRTSERCNTLKPNSSKKALTKKVPTRWPSTWGQAADIPFSKSSGQRKTPLDARSGKDRTAASGRSSGSGGRSGKGSNRAGVDRPAQSRRHRLEGVDMDAEELEGEKAQLSML
jgi:NAD dependent epimerase/dehydratase family